MSQIDFVVTWVDGNDLDWRESRRKYLNRGTDSGNTENRFRDWDLMKYWFRSVEKFAPWVRKVYFVTCGHYPEWLDLEHPKLEFVKHRDYIPAQNLPTFNSNVIELYLHQIPDLSEQFVLFNDDMFLTDYVKEEDFFQKGLPCETVCLGTTAPMTPEDVFPYTVLNNLAVINKHFSQRDVMKKHGKKFFSLKYGSELFRTVCLVPFKLFSGFYDAHLPTSHLKSTFGQIWEAEPEILEECGTHRFRSRGDVTHWLMKDWRYCEGQFVPRSNKWGKCFEIGSDPGMIQAIVKQKFKAVCLNDSDPDLDFEGYRRELAAAFDTILPERSSFEKW